MRQDSGRDTRRQLARRLHADGLSVREVAQRLNVSPAQAHRDIKAAEEPAEPVSSSRGADTSPTSTAPPERTPEDWEALSDSAISSLRLSAEQGSVTAARALAQVATRAAEDLRSKVCAERHVDIAMFDEFVKSNEITWTWMSNRGLAMAAARHLPPDGDREIVRRIVTDMLKHGWQFFRAQTDGDKQRAEDRAARGDTLKDFEYIRSSED